jgi:ribonuclease D
MNNDVIMLWGAAIHRDVQMLEYYGITVPGARDLQRQIPNWTFNYPPGLYATANAYIKTNLSKSDPEIAAIRREEWTNVPLSFEQVNYAALDARLGFEIARKCFQLAG